MRRRLLDPTKWIHTRSAGSALAALSSAGCHHGGPAPNGDTIEGATHSPLKWSPPLSDSPLLDAMRRAVSADPRDVELRLHLSGLLIQSATPTSISEAIGHLATVLQLAPTDTRAREMMADALAGPPAASGSSSDPVDPDPTADAEPVSAARTQESAHTEFNWAHAEDQLSDVIGPMFDGTKFEGPKFDGMKLDGTRFDGTKFDRTSLTGPPDQPGRIRSDGTDTGALGSEVERPTITLADVGGLQQVKERLNASFLAPLRNPELRRLYGKSLRGGMLLYGPPGCGKTFLAKAIAGEMGASFLTAGLSEIVEMWIGQSERNLHALFQQARRAAPCVLFLDEIDALGAKRSLNRGSAMRNVVNQLLAEMDGVTSQNEGVYILAATNQPWDIDPALRRPGRLDRTLLVLPPDGPAREAIFRYHLSSKPIEGINLASLAADTEGLSGADIAYLCELASEIAIMDSIRSGAARMIRMADLQAARTQVKPSTLAWLETARSVVAYGEDDGTFADLKAYLKQAKRW